MDQETKQPQVERETVLEVDPEDAWAAISEQSWLESWLAEEVELEAKEGAPARFVVDGEERHGVVREVEPGRRIAFTWRAPEEPATLVELTLTPLGPDSGVRLTVVETAPVLRGSPLASAASWTGRLRAASGAGALALAR